MQLRDVGRCMLLAGFAGLAAGVLACASGDAKHSAADSKAPPTVLLAHPSVPADKLNNKEGQDVGDLHNVLKVTPRMFSGSSPEDDEAFAELKALGVKTIISVDGAKPLADRAAAYGMHYVHVPVGYDGIDVDQQVLIAKAYRDLEGPVYVHCHHGKHRGPAAAASAAVIVGEMTPEQGVEFMRHAKTAESYPGLYECVSSITPEYLARLANAPAASSLPSVAAVSGVVDNMVGMDFCFANLEQVKKAGWMVPAEHPDIVPVAEAGRLADHYRVLSEDPECKAKPVDFAERLKKGWASAQAMEDGIAAKKDAKALDGLFAAVDQSCKDCHGKYRNKRPGK